MNRPIDRTEGSGRGGSEPGSEPDENAAPAKAADAKAAKGEAGRNAPDDPLQPPEPPDAESKEDQDLAGRPDTPVPPLEELRAAMEWAFQGEEIEPAHLDVFARHARLMLEHNRMVNLTAVIDAREVAAKHYLDSWRVVRLVPLYSKNVLDLGSGAGFPGLPVAVAAPDARVVLLDSTQKRVSFLQVALKALGLKNASAVCDRAEEHLARNSYDVVLVRAVSSVRENVRLLRKVRHSHKDLVMLKGPSWSREVRAGEREAERLGFKLDTVWEHKLPGEMGARAILVYRAPGGHGS